jgi:chromosome condensin MukBEF complex kleisin-like MukF subunit
MQAGEKIQATIQDISSVGMAIHFLKDVSFKVGAKITDLQLNLKGIRVLLSAVVMVARKDDIGATVHVLLFDPATLDMQKKDKISSFIRRCLQDKFDAALEAL